MNILLGFLSDIFTVITLLFLVIFILALLNVKSVLRNKSRKRVTITAFILFILFTIFAGAIKPTQQTQVAVVSAKTIHPTRTPIPTKPTATPTIKPTNRITLDRLALTLIIFKLTNYGDRYIGYTSDGQNNITLIGTQDNITSIYLNLNHIDKSTFSPSDISFILSGLAHQAVPEWTDANTWLENSLTSMTNSTDPTPSYQTVVGNKTITLSLDTTTNDESLSIVEGSKGQ